MRLRRVPGEGVSNRKLTVAGPQAGASREGDFGSRASGCLTRLPEPEPDRCGEARNVPVDPFPTRRPAKVRVCLCPRESRSLRRGE
jgi:hypothetical protein